MSYMVVTIRAAGSNNSVSRLRGSGAISQNTAHLYFGVEGIRMVRTYLAHSMGL